MAAFCQSDCRAVSPSPIMIEQNGQDVTIVSAPVEMASSVRSRLIRLPTFSSIHIRAPPAPQQNDRAEFRGISASVAPVASISSRGGL